MSFAQTDGLTGAGGDELRPPESWPGAAGRRSVAPDVPSWPGVRRSADPGATWPGAAPPGSADRTGDAPRANPGPTPARLSEAEVAAMTARPPANSADPALRRAWALGIALAWLAPLLAVSAWVFADPGHRGAQLAVLVGVLLCAGVHAVLGSARRAGYARWEVNDTALYAQDGPGRRHRRVLPLSALTAVERQSGFVEQAFGLRTVVVTSGADRTRVRGLAPRTARSLADRLAAHVPPPGPGPR